LTLDKPCALQLAENLAKDEQLKVSEIQMREETHHWQQ
jgi:hypothetical protein